MLRLPGDTDARLFEGEGYSRGKELVDVVSELLLLAIAQQIDTMLLTEDAKCLLKVLEKCYGGIHYIL